MRQKRTHKDIHKDKILWQIRHKTANEVETKTETKRINSKKDQNKETRKARGQNNKQNIVYTSPEGDKDTDSRSDDRSIWQENVFLQRHSGLNPGLRWVEIDTEKLTKDFLSIDRTDTKNKIGCSLMLCVCVCPPVSVSKWSRPTDTCVQLEWVWTHPQVFCSCVNSTENNWHQQRGTKTTQNKIKTKKKQNFASESTLKHTLR